MTGDISLDQPFDPGTLLALRGAVQARARQAGMPDERTQDVVLAVHELMANAIRHGAGKGRLRIWQASGALRCQVDDEGPPDPASAHPPDPAPARPPDPAPALPPDPASAHPPGPAVSADPVHPADPAASWPVRHGHGLWVVRQVADDMEVLSGPGGTRAIATFALPPRAVSP